MATYAENKFEINSEINSRGYEVENRIEAMTGISVRGDSLGLNMALEHAKTLGITVSATGQQGRDGGYCEIWVQWTEVTINGRRVCARQLRKTAEDALIVGLLTGLELVQGAREILGEGPLPKVKGTMGTLASVAPGADGTHMMAVYRLPNNEFRLKKVEGLSGNIPERELFN